MTVSAWTEVRQSVGGALRLAIGDRGGMRFFDASIDGFWRSFRAAVICYPLYLLLLGLRIAAPRWASSGTGRIIVVETIAFVISWVAFPLLILPLSRWLGRESRFLAYMVAYNWSQIPQTALFALIAVDAAVGLVTPSTARLAQLLATIAVLVYGWYIARVALSVSGAQATVVVMVDLLLGAVIGRTTEALY